MHGKHGTAMASAILCNHCNRNTVRHSSAAHRSSRGAALWLMIGGYVLVGSTYECGRMHGKHGAAMASAILCIHRNRTATQFGMVRHSTSFFAWCCPWAHDGWLCACRQHLWVWEDAWQAWEQPWQLQSCALIATATQFGIVCVHRVCYHWVRLRELLHHMRFGRPRVTRTFFVSPSFELKGTIL